MKHAFCDFKDPELGSIEDAIVRGKKIHQEYPEQGSEEFLIKTQVTQWIWSVVRKYNQGSIDEIWFLDFMKKITK